MEESELEEKIDALETRVENLEEKTQTKVRVVDTERGKQIVLENRQQTWFSPNYFRKILERIDKGEEKSETDESDEEVVLEG